MDILSTSIREDSHGDQRLRVPAMPSACCTPLVPPARSWKTRGVRPASFEAFVLPPNPPIRLLNQPGLASAALGHAIAVIVDLPRPARQAVLRRVLAPGKLLADMSGEAKFSEPALAGATPRFHPACTCAMATVVDPQARVVGVEYLCVVDASIMPTIPRGNTNILTLMLARKCAAQILSERRSG